MKYRSLNELKRDKNITPEDVAQFALFERNLSDNDKFKAICDLVLCCEKVSTLKLEARNKELEKALKSISFLPYSSIVHPSLHGKRAIAIAEKALNNSK